MLISLTAFLVALSSIFRSRAALELENLLRALGNGQLFGGIWCNVLAFLHSMLLTRIS